MMAMQRSVVDGGQVALPLTSGIDELARSRRSCADRPVLVSLARSKQEYGELAEPGAWKSSSDPTPESAGLVARIMAKELRANPHLVMGLATGRTMEAGLRAAGGDAREEGLDFSLCSHVQPGRVCRVAAGTCRFVSALHEPAPVPPGERGSAQHASAGRDGADLEAECRRYEEDIRRFGGIDLQLLGLGQAGHIGFNEPLSALRSRTRVKALTPTTIQQNAPLFDGPGKVPRRAITMGVGTILECRRCLSAGDRRGEGGDYRPSGGRPDHLDDLRHGAPVACALHGGGRWSRREPIAGGGLLPLGVRE